MLNTCSENCQSSLHTTLLYLRACATTCRDGSYIETIDEKTKHGKTPWQFILLIKQATPVPDPYHG